MGTQGEAHLKAQTAGVKPRRRYMEPVLDRAAVVEAHPPGHVGVLGGKAEP